ncbi:Nose resistant-to-fluoxetine protein, N-terminal,Acyltransferase 3 [Cinara cedri]|uniref:Nose resistant-to-fluoxetine protein, N-terminal,Acyltransferase 3 n=1 Tax=Cinara cedri TaxID=506608 RepID=A0A5E4NGE1_9HEMI|nr:Nose resistant-to-fluoxetine protein, N-terminal,Acyltransferase 3 [Cinara cedri]
MLLCLPFAPFSGPWMVVLFLLGLFGSASSTDEDRDRKGPTADIPENSDAVFPEPWISDLFYRALADFNVRDIGSDACREQTRTYDVHLRNHTYWAVRMAESWSRYPHGILAGNKYHLGVYDECVDVHYPIIGQYCLSEIKLISLQTAGKLYENNRTQDPKSFDHAWRTVLKWVDYPDRIQRNIISLGICIPYSCTASDLQTSLQEQLDEVFLPERINASVKVDPIMCTISEDKYPYNAAYYVTRTFFQILILICCSATIYHLMILWYQENKIESGKYNFEKLAWTYSFVRWFSFIDSSKNLLEYDKNNELNVFNGLKSFIMLLILLGHRFMFIAGNPMSYPELIERVYQNGPVILLTSLNIVDSFFNMSGFFTYIIVYPIFLKSGSIWIKIISPIVYRIIRILPAYCAMMAITAHIVPHFGDGPLWPQKTWIEAENCKSYWWTNVLFINNLLDVKHECLLMSWYVACDVQLFAIGVIIVFVYAKNKKYGIGLLGIMMCVSLSVPFVITYVTKTDAIVRVHLPFLENPRSSLTHNISYRPGYMRVTPYLLGLVEAMIVEKMKEKNFKFSKITVFVGSIFIPVIVLWIQFYGAIFYVRDRPYYPLEQAFYSTVNHCTWSLYGMWMCVCNFTTGYGIITKWNNNRLVVPLGRLSYSVFLVNLTVMMMSQSSQRSPTYPSTKSLLDAWIYDTFKTYLMGLALYLVVEAPFGKLTRKLFGRGKNINTSNTAELAVSGKDIELPQSEQTTIPKIEHDSNTRIS